MVVHWTTPAMQDVARITRYIRKDNLTAARAVATAIFDSGNSLADLPNRGKIGRIAGTREIFFPGWPYVLVYRVNPEAIDILRIYHGAQDWP